MNSPLRLHHYAWVTRDHEANRRFFEDVLGMPLVATWCERAYVAEIGRELEYCHAFYGLADGGAIAFFQFADPGALRAVQGAAPEAGALRPYRAEGRPQDLRGHGAAPEGRRHPVPRHRPWLLPSLYVMTPDELKLEFTLDPRQRRRDRRQAARRCARRAQALARRRPHAQQHRPQERLQMIPKVLHEHIDTAFPAHVCLVGVACPTAMRRSPRAAAPWSTTISTWRSGSAAKAPPTSSCTMAPRSPCSSRKPACASRASA